MRRCSACLKRICGHEPDVVLEEVAGRRRRPRYFHERCSGAAYTTAAACPGVYILTVRHVDASRN